MFNLLKRSALYICAFGMALSPLMVQGADCHKKKERTTCNLDEKHSKKYVGVYFRSDLPADDTSSSRPLITLNEEGTAIMYNGLGLYKFISEGTGSPAYGNWKEVGKGKILVMLLDYEDYEYTYTVPTTNTFLVSRITFLIDFSKSLNSPKIVARSVVQFDGLAPTSDYLKRNGGTLVVNEITSPIIRPYQLKRVCAFESDLFRTP